MNLDTHNPSDLITWVTGQLPDAHLLTEAETERARVALREHLTLTAAHNEPVSARRERRARPARVRRRRAWQLGLAGAVAAGAAVAVVNVGGSGSAVSPAPARAATVIAKARKALVAAPGSILDYQTTIQKGNDQPVTTHFTDDPTSGNEIIKTADSTSSTVTTGTENGSLEFYDPTTNTIGRVSNPTPAEVNTPSDGHLYANDLSRPGAQVDQNASYDGQPAIKISWPDPNQGTDTYYCSPGSYQPLAMLWGGGAGTGGTTITWTAYQSLTGSAANPSAASLTAQHPSAQVHEMDFSAWNTELNQLYK